MYSSSILSDGSSKMDKYDNRTDVLRLLAKDDSARNAFRGVFGTKQSGRSQDIITPRQALEGAKRSLREFGVDLGKAADSIKTKAGNATTSLGASFLSAYLGDPYSGHFKMRENDAINQKSKGRSVSERMSSVTGIIGRHGRSKLSDIGDNLQSGRTEWKSSIPAYMQDALSKKYGLQDLSQGSTWKHVNTGRLVGRNSQSSYWDRISTDLRQKGKQANTSIIPGYPGFGGGGYGVANDSYGEEARLLSQLRTMGGEESPEYKKYKKLLGWQ
jgi:hypothetical protein